MVIHRAAKLEEAKVMMAEGKDPIIVRANEHEVYVYTRDEKVVSNIWAGASWYIMLPVYYRVGYELYCYTRLNEDQLVQHLQDPTKFKVQINFC